MTKVVSRYGNVLSEVERGEKREELLSRRVVEIINVKIEVAGDEEFMRSSGSRREKAMKLIEED